MNVATRPVWTIVAPLAMVATPSARVDFWKNSKELCQDAKVPAGQTTAVHQTAAQLPMIAAPTAVVVEDV